MMIGGTGGVMRHTNMAGRVRRVHPATEAAAGTTSAITVLCLFISHLRNYYH